MTRVLVTGASGKTGRHVARLLLADGHDVRLASRGQPYNARLPSVRFDWTDPTTHGAALADREAIYLVAPADVTTPLDVMQPFIERALDVGIRRFVLLSASSLECGGPMMGAVHAWLARNAAEWTVLRPSWFMQNFSEQQHLPTIRDEGALYSATGSGRVAFIDTVDIATVAKVALTRLEPFNRDFILTGPRALTYEEAAATLSAVTGRPVRHSPQTRRELIDRLQRGGLRADYAALLADMDVAISNGSEDRISPAVEAITGRPPTDFVDFVGSVRNAWIR